MMDLGMIAFPPLLPKDGQTVLPRILSKISHLNLSPGLVRKDPIMEAHGGYCDVFVGAVRSDCIYHHRAMPPRNGEVKVAIKRLRVRLNADVKFAKSLAREIGVWSTLDHANILPLLGYILEKDYPSLVSEWVENGTMREFLSNNPNCDVMYLAYGVAKGLQYMHDHDVVHSDMKADNILISKYGEPLICDFGISRMLDSSQSRFVSTTYGNSEVKGSTRWMAPELLIDGLKHSKESDVWAYGMTLYVGFSCRDLEMITRRIPFSHLRNDGQIVLAMMRQELPDLPSSAGGDILLPDDVYFAIRSICTGCWTRIPKERLTMAQIISELSLQSYNHMQQSEAMQDNPYVVRSGLAPSVEQQMLQAFLQQINIPSSSPSPGFPARSGQWNLGQQGPTPEGQDIHHRPNSLSFPPVARESFGQMLQELWNSNGIKFDPRMIAIGSRTIDLYQLHTEVLQYGGVVNVRRHGSWNVIAAKMGWTPATISETGRTEEQIVEQFKTVYEQLLEPFEVTYMQAAMKQSLTAQPLKTTDNQGPGQHSAGTSQPSAQQMLAQQAMHLARLANLSMEHLRAGRYPEILIQIIAQNRPALQAFSRRMLQRFRLSQQQRQSQEQLPQQMQQPGSALNAQLPFPRQLGTSNASSLNIQGAVPGANAPGHPGISNQSNDVPMQRSQLTAQHLTSQNVHMVGTLTNPRKPTMEANKQALLLIEQMKVEIAKDRPIRPEHIKQLSDTEKDAFREPFEAVCSSLGETCRYLHIYLAATNDLQAVRGILSMRDVCDKQRQLLQSVNPPTFILDVATLQKLMKTCTDVKVKVSQVMQHILAQGDHNQACAPMSQQGGGGSPPPSAPQQGPSQRNIAQSPASMPYRPPQVQHHPDDAAYSDSGRPLSRRLRT